MAEKYPKRGGFDRPFTPTQQLERFFLTTPTPGATDKKSQFYWGMRNGIPVFTVFTGMKDPKTDKAQVLSVTMYPDVLMMFLDVAIDFIEGKLDPSVGDKLKLNCESPVYEDGKMTDQKRMQGSLAFGRDNEGVFWIAILADNKPKLRFNFKTTGFYSFVKSDGTAFSTDVLSKFHARAVLGAVRDVYLQHLKGFKPNGEATTSEFKKIGSDSDLTEMDVKPTANMSADFADLDF